MFLPQPSFCSQPIILFCILGCCHEITSELLVPPVHFDAPQLSTAADTLLAQVLRTYCERAALYLGLLEKALLLTHHHLQQWAGHSLSSMSAKPLDVAPAASDKGFGANALPQGALGASQLRELRSTAKKAPPGGGASLASLVQEVVGLGGRQVYTPKLLGMAEHQMQLVRLVCRKIASLLEVSP